jgi:hypothetical protein
LTALDVFGCASKGQQELLGQLHQVVLTPELTQIEL